MFHAEPAGIRSWSSELEVGDLLLLKSDFYCNITIVVILLRKWKHEIPQKTRCTHWRVPCQKGPSLYLFLEFYDSSIFLSLMNHLMNHFPSIYFDFEFLKMLQI